MNTYRGRWTKVGAINKTHKILAFGIWNHLSYSIKVIFVGKFEG